MWMTNPELPDPRRGPRRYGPSAAASAAGDQQQPGRNPQPPNPAQPGYPQRQPYPGGHPGGAGYPGGAQYPGPNPSYQPRPAAPQQPAWSQTNPPTAKLPPYQEPHRPLAPTYGGPAAVPAAFGGGTPPGGRPPGGRPPGPPLEPPVPDAPRRRRTATPLLVARIVAAALAAVTLIAAGSAWAFTGALQANSGTSDAANNAGDGGVISADGLTILLVGSDARTDADGNPLSAEELAQVGTEDDGGGINTDTIMLVHIPQGGGKATAVSLPRDTWISQKVIDQVAGPYADGSEGQYAPNKINSYYSTAKAFTEEYLVSQGVTDKAQIERESNEAGRTMLIRVAQAFTGMKVDHYAEVNLLGFYLLSNAIGGIPVCLNAAVNDPWSGADFAAGPQEVQGTAALAFVRQRHGLPEGDLDRVRRQQAFLSGAADKILSVGTLTNPSKLSDLVDAINRSVIFDKGFSVLTFAEQISNLSSGNITFETLPTTGRESSTDKDALATDPVALKAFFAQITGAAAATPEQQAPVDPSSITVDLQDGTIADGVTSFAAETINTAGFTLGSLGVVAGTKSGNEQATTEVHYPPGAPGTAQQVAAAFGIGQLVEDDAIKSGHVLLVVGTDMDTSGAPATEAATSEPAAVEAAPAASATTEAVNAGSVRCVN